MQWFSAGTNTGADLGTIETTMVATEVPSNLEAASAVVRTTSVEVVAGASTAGATDIETEIFIADKTQKIFFSKIKI